MMVMPLLCFSQKKNDSLVTSIGWVIRQGDYIQLRNGTMDNGRFKFIQSPEAVGGSSALSHLPNKFGNKKYKVTKIKIFRGSQIPVISIGKIMGFENRFDVEIEGAISSGEIIVPEEYRKSQSATGPSKADELAKLKKLLDDGVLTKEEFEKEKKKLLDN